MSPDRRGFLLVSGRWVAASALLAGTQPALAADEKRPYKKSLKIGMVGVPGTLSEKFRLLKRLGYDGVELNSPGGPKPDEVRAAIDASGLVVPGVVDGVHWRQRLSDPDAEVRAAGVKALMQAIGDVKQYGGTSVLLVPGRVDNSATYEQCWQRSMAELKKAIPLAEDQGIHILIENVWNDFLTDPAEMARYIDEADSKMVGAYFDVGNAVRYAPPVKWIEELGSRIVKLDIKEYSLVKAKDDPRAGFGVKLGEGDCDWPAVRKALKKVGYTSGWGSAEVRGGDEARLREISERMDLCLYGKA